MDRPKEGFFYRPFGRKAGLQSVTDLRKRSEGAIGSGKPWGRGQVGILAVMLGLLLVTRA
jgi:hypothetical protein